MKPLAIELRKLMIKRHLAVVLAVLLIAETISFYTALNKRVNSDEESAAVYREYMNEYSGELTEERIAQIEQAIEERSDMEALKKQYRIQFIEGEIDIDDYKAETARLKEATKGESGFRMFVTAFENAKYASNAYLSDNTVWNVLLGDGGIDFLPVFAVILMIAAMTVYDDEIGINKLRFSTKYGKSAQLIIAVLTAVLISAAIFIGKIAIAASFYNLGGYSNPIYSAENFMYSPLSVSLLDSYILMSVIKTAGLVYLALLTMMIGQICRSSLYTVFVGLLTVYLPAYVLSDIQIRYLMPIPSSLLSGVGYFYALEMGSFEVTGAEQMRIHTFSDSQLTLFFISVGAVIILLMIANRLMWTKRRSFR